MRIPPSAIVMGVLTAVPFGLGIRDTLTHRADAAPRLTAEQRLAEVERGELERLDTLHREHVFAELFAKLIGFLQ